MSTSTQTPNPYPWRRALVYGLGISGRAAAALLRRHGVAVVLVDERPADALDLGSLGADPAVEGHFGGVPQSLAAVTGDGASSPGVDAVVVSPGVPADRPLLVDARRQGVSVLAEVELAFRSVDGPVVAITGSNGKSTTTAMAGAMLRAAGRRVEVCGNIGEALSSRVMADEPPGRVFVVELSSFQLEAVETFHAGAAALLNLSPDHLDRHAGYAEYRAAKERIFERQTAEDLAVLNADDPELAGLETVAPVRWFSSRQRVEDGCHLHDGAVWEVGPGGEGELFRPDDVPLPGPHNLENAMAAALLARHHGVEPAAIVTALRDFRGLPHRLERVRERAGVVWFDDSKGTNLAATARSLEGFEDGRVHVILGGRYKGGDLGDLCDVVARKARRAYLIGEAEAVFAQALADHDVALERLGTLDRAVARIAELAQSGEVAVLSPACSSFDQFPNFAERGRIFQRRVRALDPALDLEAVGGGQGATWTAFPPLRSTPPQRAAQALGLVEGGPDGP